MIGEKIKKFRESKNLSQEFVADYLGISQGAYSRLKKKLLNFLLNASVPLRIYLKYQKPSFSHPMMVWFLISTTLLMPTFITLLRDKKRLMKVIEVLKQQLHESNQEKKTLLELLKDRQHQG